jgi:hypothetical protein
VLRPAESIDQNQLLCSICSQECGPVFLHSLSRDSQLLKKTPRQLGLPSWDIVWARGNQACLGFEFAADNPWTTASPAPATLER